MSTTSIADYPLEKSAKTISDGNINVSLVFVMRAEAFRGNTRYDLPRCVFCSNPQVVKGVLYSLGTILVTALMAYASAKYFDIEVTAGPTMGNKFVLLGNQGQQISTVFNSIEEGGPLIDALKSVIRKELDVYDSDKTGITDYALENLGGCIISTRGTVTYADGSASLTLFGIPLMSFATDPRAILQPSTLPGDCWAFEGSQGRAVIKLMTEIIVTGISLEHISKDLSPSGDISSAPKEVLLFGLSCLEDESPHYFGSFIYSSSGPTVQTFKVTHKTLRPFNLVEVVFKSNHGNNLFTCVYRVRIHGKLPNLDKSDL